MNTTPPARTPAARAWLLLLALVPACYAYQPLPLEPLPRDLPANAHITRRDSSVVVLAVAQVIGDTIRGFREGSTRRVDIPLSDVQRIEVREMMPRETAITTAVVAGGFILLLQVLRRDPGPPLLSAP